MNGYEATTQDALERAMGMDWMEIPTEVGTTMGLEYIDTVNGVGVYYNPATDTYEFTDETSSGQDMI